MSADQRAVALGERTFRRASALGERILGERMSERQMGVLLGGRVRQGPKMSDPVRGPASAAGIEIRHPDGSPDYVG